MDICIKFRKTCSSVRHCVFYELESRIGVLDWSHVIGVLDWSHVIGVLDWIHVIGVLDWSHVIGVLDWSHVVEYQRGFMEWNLGTKFWSETENLIPGILLTLSKRPHCKMCTNYISLLSIIK